MLAPAQSRVCQKPNHFGLTINRLRECRHLSVAEVSPVGVLTLRQPHVVAWISRDVGVLDRRTQNLTKNAKSVSIVGTPTSSCTISATQARTAAVLTSATAKSPHLGLTLLDHELRRVAAVFTEMCPWQRDQHSYNVATVIDPALGGT